MRGQARRDDFEAFVAARRGALLRTSFLLTGHSEAAQDLLQDALVRLYSRWDRVREPQAREAYLRRILATTAANQRRRRWHAETPSGLSAPDRTGADPFAGEDTRQLVVDALRGLPPAHRAVLVLRFWEDLSEAQTAEVLGCSVGTVKSRTARALARLRDDGALLDTQKEHR